MNRALKLVGIACASTMLVLVVVGPLMPNLPTKALATCEDRVLAPIKAYRVAVDGVRGQLKAPTTATFSPMSESEVRATDSKARKFLVRGTVDSQNSFGAMLRGRFEAEVQGSNTEPFELISARLR